ncbi:hypothetical protein DESACE_06100 [Desulfurella acetivorans A63]|nr:hypothetical protein DESACE_06100 [Desulfurella acetivorans A63]
MGALSEQIRIKSPNACKMRLGFFYLIRSNL